MQVMIKGWCPGALRPMPSGDGLIVRLRISGGIVGTALATQIARWSRAWGNGQIDLSARANLQLRGLSEQTLPRVHDAMGECGLLDASAAGEAVRNVISSPLAGLDPDAALDIRPVAAGLEQRLAGDAVLHDLSGKFGFAIDDGGRIGLQDVPVDIRFVARKETSGPVFAINLAGAAQEWFGPCRPNAVADVAAALAVVFLDARKRYDAGVGRMGDLVARLGAEAVARRAGLQRFRLTPAERNGAGPDDVLGVHPLSGAAYLGVGLPFGRIAAEDLARFAATARANGAPELRLTPWRAIIAPVPTIEAAHASAAALTASAFILDPGDPRRRIAACPGAPDCLRATTPVRDDAVRLAGELAGAPGSGILVHLSGCDKGCAHPGRAPITLVACQGRYHLVRDGIASDRSDLAELTTEQAALRVRRIVAGRPRAGLA